MTTKARRLLLDPLLDENPIGFQILGICSALAVTTSVGPALTMSLALLTVLTLSSGIISAIRRAIPRSVRLIVQVTIIASLVVVVDQVLQAFAPAMSKTLSVFVSLIVTNCIVLGRAESFAMRKGVARSLLDGFGNGLGYSLFLITMGAVRELLGTGTLLGRVVLTPVDQGGWFHALPILGMPPGAFVLLGCLTWLLHALRPQATGAGTEDSHV